MNKAIQHLQWACDTIAEKLMFGRDEIGAGKARELRAKGVLLDCKKEITRLKKALEIANEAMEDFELRNSHSDDCGIRYQYGGGCNCMDLKYYSAEACEERLLKAQKQIKEVMDGH